jgi:hypothetical protein
MLLSKRTSQTPTNWAGLKAVNSRTSSLLSVGTLVDLSGTQESEWNVRVAAF